YKEARDRGIKPIIGIEAYVAPRSMEQREGKQDAGGHHLVLLAENEAGYRNLLTLATEAQLRGFYYKPRIDKDLLARHSDGLIALSACLSSEVARRLLRDDVEGAEKAARWYAEVFPRAYYPEALKNTMAIAERCDLQLEFGRVQLPEMPVPEGHTLDTYLAEACRRRLAERYPEVTPAMRERLDYELAVIKKTGFAAYFLL